MSAEGPLINACLIFLRMQGCWVDRLNTGAMRIQARGRRDRFVRFGRPGMPDIVGIGPAGHYIGVEAKRGITRVTPAQTAFHQEIRQRGGFSAIIRSVDELVAAWRARFGSVKGAWT